MHAMYDMHGLKVCQKVLKLFILNPWFYNIKFQSLRFNLPVYKFNVCQIWLGINSIIVYVSAMNQLSQKPIKMDMILI